MTGNHLQTCTGENKPLWASDVMYVHMQWPVYFFWINLRDIDSRNMQVFYGGSVESS